MSNEERGLVLAALRSYRQHTRKQVRGLTRAFGAEADLEIPRWKERVLSGWISDLRREQG